MNFRISFTISKNKKTKQYRKHLMRCSLGLRSVCRLLEKGLTAQQYGVRSLLTRCWYLRIFRWSLVSLSSGYSFQRIDLLSGLSPSLPHYLIQLQMASFYFSFWMFITKYIEMQLVLCIALESCNLSTHISFLVAFLSIPSDFLYRGSWHLLSFTSSFVVCMLLY